MHGRRSIVALLALLLVTGTAALVLVTEPFQRTPKAKREAANVLPITTIETLGEILGVGIGATMDEAREKFERFRDPVTEPVREKNRSGEERHIGN